MRRSNFACCDLLTIRFALVVIAASTSLYFFKRHHGMLELGMGILSLFSSGFQTQCHLRHFNIHMTIGLLLTRHK